MRKRLVIELTPSAYQEIVTQMEKYYMNDPYKEDEELLRKCLRKEGQRSCTFNSTTFIETFEE